MNAASADDTGVLTAPARSSMAFDDELRRDISTAAWMMAAVAAPGLALLALVM